MAACEPLCVRACLWSEFVLCCPGNQFLKAIIMLLSLSTPVLVHQSVLPLFGQLVNGLCFMHLPVGRSSLHLEVSLCQCWFLSKPSLATANISLFPVLLLSRCSLASCFAILAVSQINFRTFFAS